MTKIRRKAALRMYRSPRWGTECAEEKAGRPADGGQNTKARSIFLKNSINLRYSQFRFSLKRYKFKIVKPIDQLWFLVEFLLHTQFFSPAFHCSKIITYIIFRYLVLIDILSIIGCLECKSFLYLKLAPRLICLVDIDLLLQDTYLIYYYFVKVTKSQLHF